MHPDGARLIATLTLNTLADCDATYIGGLEMGAVPLAAAIAAISSAQGRPLGAFFVRKEAKTHGTQQLIEGLARDESLSGKSVVVIEDVTTTGGSAIKAAEILQNEGAKVVRVVTVVDRQEGAAEAFDAAGLPFVALLTAADFVG